MIGARSFSNALMAAAVVAGTIADRPPVNPPLFAGGYRVLAADFHTHSSTLSDGALTPFGMVLEARRQRLDVIAVTGHNQLSDARVARWYSRIVGAPVVLVGEEVLTGPRYHLIAVGVTKRVGFLQPAAAAIDEIHRQGGVAIAAHPTRGGGGDWFDRAALERLDGAEICHPLIYVYGAGQRDLEDFRARAPLAAIGSSDFHGTAAMGLCRTFVFARDASEPSILEAIRAHRTVVYGLDGRAYGDPAMIRLGEGLGLAEAASPRDPKGALDWFSRVAGVAGLAFSVAIGRSNSSRRSAA